MNVYFVNNLKQYFNSGKSTFTLQFSHKMKLLKIFTNVFYFRHIIKFIQSLRKKLRNKCKLFHKTEACIKNQVIQEPRKKSFFTFCKSLSGFCTREQTSYPNPYQWTQQINK